MVLLLITTLTDALTTTVIATTLTIRIPIIVMVTLLILLSYLWCVLVQLRLKTKEIFRQFPTTGDILSLTHASKLDFTLLVQTIGNSKCSPDFYMLFLATKQNLRTKLRVVFTSSVSGYVIPPGYPFTAVPTDMKASHTLSVHKHQSLMLSFKQQPGSSPSGVPFLTVQISLSIIHPHSSAKIMWSRRGLLNTPAVISNSSVSIKLLTQRPCIPFKIVFSLHTHPDLPQQSRNGFFNCSVAHYASFKDHLHCNLKPECEGREDEGGHCPFSSPACDGKMAVAGTKCYSLHVSDNKISWLEAQKLCEVKSAKLATIRFKEEVGIFLKMLRIANRAQLTYIGLTMDKTVPNLYRHAWRWDGNRIAYSAPNIKGPVNERLGCYAVFNTLLVLKRTSTIYPMSFSYACEHESSTKSLHTDLQKTEPDDVKLFSDEDFSLTQRTVGPPLAVCLSGYLTHDFLKCDLQAACLVKRYEPSCPLGNTAVQEQGPSKEHVRMFACDNLIHTIPYTLVCNFASDCLDGSDEKFCQHDQNVCDRSQHQCANGQCVSLGESRPSVACDRVSDCYDESDEAPCQHFNFLFKPVTISPPARIDFDQSYTMTATALDSADRCPNTHFKCLGSLPYCLPVYVRCNDFYDCPLGEDELHCKEYICRGLYHCRGTNACVHVTQLCDGVAQCQGRDDESMCDLVCPDRCQCQGWSFVCSQFFVADSFGQLRYLDAGYSLMTLSHFVSNHYLIWLSLRSCQLEGLSNVSLGNLQRLDVSNNIIQSLDAGSIGHLPSLKEIALSNNPLEKITVQDVSMKHTALQKIDMSSTHLSEFDCGVFSSFPMTTFFNFSHCGTVKITKKIFSCFTYLNELDIRGTNIVQNELSLLGKMQHIETVFSDDYRHCCSVVMPHVQHEVLCLAPMSGFSSCTDLFRSQVLQAYLWIMTILCFVGNPCCLLARHRHNKNAPSPTVDIYLISLMVANLIMGMYLCIIVVAGVRFHGNFLLHEKNWVNSYSCRIAGFLALLSTEASSLVVFLLSVDRLVAISFSSKRLQRKSAWLTCLLSWLIAALLTSVCMMVSAGESGGTTNLCITVPTLKNDPSNVACHLSVLVVCKMVLALITCICQSFVYYRVISTYVVATNTHISQDMVLARRVMTLVATDVIWRLGITMAGLLASVMNVDLFVTLFVLGLPLKPVLNPLIYTNSLLAEKKKLKEESRLLMLVKRNFHPKVVKLPPAKPKPRPLLPSFANREDVFSCLGQCLQSEILNVTDVESIVLQNDDV